MRGTSGACAPSTRQPPALPRRIRSVAAPSIIWTNGRYPDREFLLRFLDAADKMDALERIVLLEEPFAGDRPEPVHGLPVRVAGDESAHSAQDVARLTWEYGYSAIACKPIAKTLSVTLEMVRAAQKSARPVMEFVP